MTCLKQFKLSCDWSCSHVISYICMWSYYYMKQWTIVTKLSCDWLCEWSCGHVISHMDMLSYYYMKQWYSVIKLVVLICDMTCFETIPNYHSTGHVVMWLVMWSVILACDHIIIWNNELASLSWSFWYAIWHILIQFQIIMRLVMWLCEWSCDQSNGHVIILLYETMT